MRQRRPQMAPIVRRGDATTSRPTAVWLLTAAVLVLACHNTATGAHDETGGIDSIGQHNIHKAQANEINDQQQQSYFSGPPAGDVATGGGDGDATASQTRESADKMNGDSPIVEHGKGRHLRFKREADSRNSDDGQQQSDNRMTRLIQYNGWHPVDLNNPLNNEPTVSYKPPPLQKVHFGEDPPSTKPLYPVVPKNPPVYVVRKEKATPEIDEVYGTEKVEYIHIQPKSKTIKAFQPAGNARILKFVKRLDSVKPSEQSKRSHSNPNDFFLPPENGPNYDISKFNFSLFNNNGNRAHDLDGSFSENNPRMSFSHPFLRILPPGSSPGGNPSVANARGILPPNISPQQILQARLNLARLPLMTPLHGLFGSFTQIPLGSEHHASSSKVGDAVVKEVAPPSLLNGATDHMVSEPSEPVGTVVFARSRSNIDRSDSADYFDDMEDDFGKIKIIPSKPRLRHSPNKPRKTSKTIAANSLSELLQIFKYTNATEPPPEPTTTPPPVTIMKGFRYTKPTELPPTTTTTRPTTTKRFRLPTAFRYTGNSKQNSYIQNTLTTTTPRPLPAARITIAPTYTPKSSKSVTGIPDLIFDNVAETNSLDGYLFSDSEASPEYRKVQAKPKIVQKGDGNVIEPLAVPKALSSKRISIRLIGEDQEKEEIIHSKNSQPLKSEFEIIYTKKGRTTVRPETKQDSPFTIIQGHSKVSVFRPPNVTKNHNVIVSTTSTPTSTSQNKPVSNAPTSSIPSQSTSHSDEAQMNESTSDFSILTGDTPSKTQREQFEYDDSNYETYDYFRDLENPESRRGHRPLQDYTDSAYNDEPSYLLRRPWMESENPVANPTQVSFVKLPPPQHKFGSDGGPHDRELFIERLSQAPVSGPSFSFLENLGRSMPTSAVPTTWQDYDVGASHHFVTREPTSSTSGDSSSHSSDLDSIVNNSDGQRGSPVDIETKSQQREQQPTPVVSEDQHSITEASDRIAEEVKASIIESIVTEPFATETPEN